MRRAAGSSSWNAQFNSFDDVRHGKGPVDLGQSLDPALETLQ